ncbi:LysR family transcriptional regulator [Corallococcus exiguus]|uniref:LysR family transcriptional regulator n=1 Tax=Corallococcus TaxID=83461 RepID=UPI000EB85EAB|nr:MULTISPECIES: LysR family transcriptional regulator [Corallococcus]NNC14870.1 LysR family transcriptional regulator [Corallococcus exiguus]RKI13273.1 LysR family transcriptional regulator [Corallococcus sp. AB030]
MNSISEIEVFIKAVDLGGFTRAAENLGLTPSGVSRIISRLEGRLGVRLLNRTTRSLSLTDEGAVYHEHCTRMLAELEAVNATLARTSVTPRGRLRVDVPIPLADYVVGPALPRFLERYPDVSIDLTVRDRIIDPTAEGVDVVLRLAPTRDSDLVSRKLARARSILVASPAYLTAHGRPRTLASLREHTCIAYLSNTGPLPWRLKGPGGEVTFAARGRFMAGSGNVLTHAALGGLGIIQTYEYHVAEHLSRGKLELILEDLEPEPRTVFALFERHKSAVPKVRVFLDFVAELFASRAPLATGRKRR